MESTREPNANRDPLSLMIEASASGFKESEARIQSTANRYRIGSYVFIGAFAMTILVPVVLITVTLTVPMGQGAHDALLPIDAWAGMLMLPGLATTGSGAIVCWEKAREQEESYESDLIPRYIRAAQTMYGDLPLADKLPAARDTFAKTYGDPGNPRYSPIWHAIEGAVKPSTGDPS